MHPGRQSPKQAGLQALTPNSKTLGAVPQPSSSGIDTMAPSASDPALPLLAEPPDHHQHHISGISHDGSKPQCRSLPPTRRSPGPPSGDSVSNQQLAQIFDILKGLTLQFNEFSGKVSSCGGSFPGDSFFSRRSFCFAVSD